MTLSYVGRFFIFLFTEKLESAFKRGRPSATSSSAVRYSSNSSSSSISSSSSSFNHEEWLRDIHVDLLPIADMEHTRVILVTREGTVLHAAIAEHTEEEDLIMESPHRWQPELHRTQLKDTKLTEKEELLD